MKLLRHLALVILLAFSFAASSGPAVFASMYDGLDNDNDGQVDEPDEYDGAGNSMDLTQQECADTARLEPCLFTHNMFCQQFGLPQACALAQLGNNCKGGDPQQCQYYQAVMQSETACRQGDQQACAWEAQQPVIAQFK